MIPRGSGSAFRERGRPGVGSTVDQLLIGHDVSLGYGRIIVEIPIHVIRRGISDLRSCQVSGGTL